MTRRPAFRLFLALAIGATGIRALDADLARRSPLEELTERIRRPFERPDRICAAETMALYGERAVPILRELLLDSDSGVRHAACIGLVRMGPEARGAVRDLVKIAADADDPLQRTAVDALLQIGPDAAPALSVFRALAWGSDAALRYRAVCGLRAVGGEAVPVLIELLRHEDVEVRREVTAALRDIGPAAAGAGPALALAINDSDERVGDVASQALAAIGAPAIPELLALLRDQNTITRRRAVRVLSHMGCDAAPVASALAEALGDDDAAVRFWAAKALGEIGEPTPHTVACLTAALRDSDADVRWQAAASLARAGAAAVEPLAELLHDPHPAVRAQAERILGGRGGKQRIGSR
jgi:HEAT repeat protein